MSGFMQKVREGWKAVVALAIPVLIGALATILDGFGDWIATQEGVWVGLATGLISGIAVWLKRNASPTG